MQTWVILNRIWYYRSWEIRFGFNSGSPRGQVGQSEKCGKGMWGNTLEKCGKRRRMWGKVWKKERDVRKQVGMEPPLQLNQISEKWKLKVESESKKVKSVEKGKECEEARWEGASCNWTRSLHICHRRKLLREGIFQTYFSEQEYLLSTFNSFRSLTPISSRFWSNNLIHIIMIWHFNLKRGRNRINMVKK